MSAEEVLGKHGWRFQASCGDCGFHHPTLKCPFRNGRKEELRRDIKYLTDELQMLEDADARRILSDEKEPNR